MKSTYRSMEHCGAVSVSVCVVPRPFACQLQFPHHKFSFCVFVSLSRRTSIACFAPSSNDFFCIGIIFSIQHVANDFCSQQCLCFGIRSIFIFIFFLLLFSTSAATDVLRYLTSFRVNCAQSREPCFQSRIV